MARPLKRMHGAGRLKEMSIALANTIPMLPLLRAAQRRVRHWQHRVADYLRGESAEFYFDLTNAVEVNAELQARGVRPLTIDADEALDQPARYILANLVCNPAVRRHFPTALSGAADGGFLTYLQLGLNSAAAGRVADCLRNPPDQTAARVLEVREDLRSLYPFAATPRQRRQFLAWLLAHGRRELGIEPESALWHLIKLDETCDRGLIPAYLTNPQWQADVPNALDRRGWPGFIRYLAARYGIRGRWLRRARWRPVKPDTARGGVNVIGHYRYISGLQEACKGVAAALERQRLTVARRDLPVNFPADWRDRERYQSLEWFDTTIYVAAANTFPSEYCRRSGLHFRDGVYRIGVWYWEVDRLPPEWRGELGWANEVWAPTRFLAEAFRRSVSVPVLPMLPGLELPAFKPKPRSYFNLPDNRFLVLFSFDMGSVMERKNPLGLIEAFRRAFHPDDRAHLCIKVSRGNCDPANMAKLTQACRDTGATLLDRVLPREDLLALLGTADCYASLHRAEGLGLGMAESMLLGKPVIGTAYSGNLDFMTDQNSFLVQHSLVAIPEVGPYPPGCQWAEPDIDHSASLLRRVRFDSDAAAIAERGQREVAKLLSVEAAGQRMLARLWEIGR